MGGAAGFLNTFVGPTALKNIGYWFYVFFVFWDVFEVIIMYFFFVETKVSDSQAQQEYKLKQLSGSDA